VLSLSRTRARICGGPRLEAEEEEEEEGCEWRCGPSCSGRWRKVGMVRCGRSSEGDGWDVAV
jgi:hypothetical protein